MGSREGNLVVATVEMGVAAVEAVSSGLGSAVVMGGTGVVVSGGGAARWLVRGREVSEE
jgi:hypothetical protein